jgi:hypothetical protein
MSLDQMRPPPPEGVWLLPNIPRAGRVPDVDVESEILPVPAPPMQMSTSLRVALEVLATMLGVVLWLVTWLVLTWE